MAAIEDNGVWCGGSYFSLAKSTCLACIKSNECRSLRGNVLSSVHYKLPSPVCANGTRKRFTTKTTF